MKVIKWAILTHNKKDIASIAETQKEAIRKYTDNFSYLRPEYILAELKKNKCITRVRVTAIP